MKIFPKIYMPIGFFLCFAAASLPMAVAFAADEDVFFGEIQLEAGQSIGLGQTALWTLPDVATQYQPLQLTPEMRTALQAQHEGRFLDALIQLDSAVKNGQFGTNTKAEINLLRASFLLQGNQPHQTQEILAYLLDIPQYAADAYALTAMAHLQQGKMREALETANRAHDLADGMLQNQVLSYALQGVGRLAEAREVMHGFNARPSTGTSEPAIALAREAELALTMNQTQTAMMLLDQAHEKDDSHPYVLAVSGLTWLIVEQAGAARAAFETALQRDPKDTRALLGLGLAEIKLGNLQAGQERLQAAHETDPGNALVLTYLGRTQQHNGQIEAARASWRDAQQADPKDPTPWLYQAQAELQANRLLQARESLREAQARVAYRSVYRGEHLLKEDEQLLQTNLAEIQRRMGQENLAFHTLNDVPGKKNSASLKNQADVLQGQRFGESARRSLLLQSLFNDRPGNLLSELDIYGDGAGQTGAQVPQHGVVGVLNAQQASYNNYDGLFVRNDKLAVDATVGGNNSNGEQIRLGVGNDTLGVSLAGLQFKTDGHAPYTNLDNRVAQGIVQWQPAPSTQAFVSYQTFHSARGEIICPADPFLCAVDHQLEDNSDITRLGLRYSLNDSSELRGLASRQQTKQTDNWEWASDFLPPSDPWYTGPGSPFYGPDSSYGIKQNRSTASSVELQYRRNGAGYTTQWGLSTVRSPLYLADFGDASLTNIAQQVYMDWQQVLNQYWELEAGLAWGKNEKLLTLFNSNQDTRLLHWLPKLGLAYTPDNATHIRMAAWKGIDTAAIGNASLAPATLAGIVLNRPGDTYQLVRSVALGADRQLDAAWLLEGQAQRRWMDYPFFANSQQMSSSRVDESHLALHWQGGQLIAILSYDDERILHDPAFVSPDSILSQHLRAQQLGLRWLTSEQWTASLTWSHNLLDVTQQMLDAGGQPSVLVDVNERFSQTNVGLTWQFNRKGALDFGVRNATNTSSQYTEIDPLIPRFSKGRFGYARLKFTW